MNIATHRRENDLQSAATATDSSEPVANETERQLAVIWTSLFSKEVGVNDNYFELGGDSLLAQRLFGEMERRFGVRIPLSTLFEAPTVRQLADCIRKRRFSSRSSSLVAIQPGGSRSPLFCVHGAGGNVLYYYGLARRLGPDQPFYGLQSQGLDGRRPFLTRIEEMAAAYIKDIRAVQPAGPYLLAGYCLGGTIAFEMAQQLSARGERVALLALMDTQNWANISANSLSDRISICIHKLVFHWGNFSLLGTKDRGRFLKEKLRALGDRKRVWVGSLVLALSRRARSSTQSSVSLARLWKINDHAALAYVPKIYPGRIVQFRPMKQYAKQEGPAREWDGLAAEGVEKITLSVYPAGMMVEPFVEMLAARMNECIERAVANIPNPTRN